MRYKNDEYHEIAEYIQSNNHFVTLRDSKKIWYWDRVTGLYLPNGESYIEELVEKITNQTQIKTRNEVIAIIKSKTYINSDDFFNSDYITSLDGVLDPNTFENLGHAPDFYSTQKLPFNIESEAKNYKLWRHILTIIDPRDINLLMELIWICISRKNPFKKLFIFMGLTNTQKSTLADIIAWIVGEENVSRVKPQKFLSKYSRFDTSMFVGKSINIASEIGNLSKEEIESLKGLVGAEKQYTEKKNDNTAYVFDPNKFVFLFTTNELGGVYANIDDNSTITRLQFMIFRNQINEFDADGLWYDNFFTDEDDKQDAIDTIVRLVIAYKKKKIKTKWSSVADTKAILKQNMPLEDKYFSDSRIVPKQNSQLTIDEIKKDFEGFTGHTIDNQKMGYILKKNDIKTTKSNGKTVIKNYSFRTEESISSLI